MPTGQRAFIETVIAEVRDAKELVLPLLMLGDPEEPLTPASLRALAEQRDALQGVLRDAVELLIAFELPFLEEEQRLEGEGLTLETDMGGFEVAMVDFERAFWDRAYAEYLADPERFALRERPDYDLCPEHKLSTKAVRAAITEHEATDFDDLARYLGTSRACADCHKGVTRLLLQDVKRRKAAAEA